MERRVDIVIGQAPLDVIEGSRDPGFMSVDQMPVSTFRFRFRLEKQGHDDSTGQDFDWWFQGLVEAATAANMKGKGGPSVTVMERIYDDGVYYQNQWEGLLGKDAENAPRHGRNRNVFQFDLKVATFTKTRTREEDLPPLGRWASGNGDNKDVTIALKELPTTGTVH